jgi:hypothetical protein
MEKPPEANETVRLNDVVYSSRLGGHRYEGRDIHAPHLLHKTAVTRE